MIDLTLLNTLQRYLYMLLTKLQAVSIDIDIYLLIYNIFKVDEPIKNKNVTGRKTNDSKLK